MQQALKKKRRRKRKIEPKCLRLRGPGLCSLGGGHWAVPSGSVSPAVYPFLRAIAPRRLPESGTQPGAVLVTLKFLLQFCQIRKGDFTSPELQRLRGRRRASPGERGSERAGGSEPALGAREGPANDIIPWPGIKWEGCDSRGLVKLWLQFYTQSFQSAHVLHLRREFSLSDVHEVCFFIFISFTDFIPNQMILFALPAFSSGISILLLFPSSSSSFSPLSSPSLSLF